MGTLLLKNALLLTQNKKDMLFAGSVFIQDRIIKQVAHAGDAIKLTADHEVDLQGALLIPGFVQMHTHLCQASFRNLAENMELLDWLQQKIWPYEAAHTEESLYDSARLGIAELLLGGTTSILDMGTVAHTDSIFNAVQEMGIRAHVGKCMMDLESNPDQLRESTNESLLESVRLLEKWHGKEEGRISYAFAPRFVLSCTEDLLKEVGSVANAKGILVHTHASENREEIKAVKEMHGCENIEYLEQIGLCNDRLVLAHCVWLSDKERAILKSSKTRIAHCPGANLKLASGIAPIPELLAEGIIVGLGADGAPCNNRMDMFAEMRLAALIQKPRLGPKAMNTSQVFRHGKLLMEPKPWGLRTK